MSLIHFDNVSEIDRMSKHVRPNVCENVSRKRGGAGSSVRVAVQAARASAESGGRAWGVTATDERGAAAGAMADGNSGERRHESRTE